MTRFVARSFLLSLLIIPALMDQARCQTLAAPLQDANPQFLDCRVVGNAPCPPLAGGKLTSYAAGTTTPLATCATTTLSGANCATPNANPVILNSYGYNAAGSGTTGIWPLPARCYKFKLTDSSNVTIWTIDNVCNQVGLLQAALAASTGAGLIGFSQSASYPAATVGKKLQQVISITDPPYNANCNGSADTTSAWTAAMGALSPNGGEIRIPNNQNCFTSTGIVLTHGVPLKVSGTGRSSVISCTGITCLTANYAGQIIESLDVQESAAGGNASTVGIEVTNSSGSGDQITIRDVTLLGKSAHPNGIGIRLDGVANVAVDNVTSAFWDKGGQINALSGPTYSTTIHFIGGHFTGNATWQMENTGCGDCSAFGTIFESGPGLSTAFGIFTTVACHMESGTVDAEIKSGASGIISIGSTWHGGTIQADAGSGLNNAVFISYGDDITDLIVNNSSFPMKADWPTHPPTAANISGSNTSAFLINDVTGWHCLKNGGCAASNTFTIDSPYTQYQIPLPTKFGNASTNPTSQFLGTGLVTFNGALSATTNTQPMNDLVDCTGASTYCSGASTNNALAATFLDPAGAPITIPINMTFTLRSAGHSFQIGANTVNINNLGDLPVKAQSTGNNLTATFGSGSFLFVVGSGVLYLVGGL